MQGVLDHSEGTVERELRPFHINDAEFAEEIVAMFEKLSARSGECDE